MHAVFASEALWRIMRIARRTNDKDFGDFLVEMCVYMYEACMQSIQPF